MASLPLSWIALAVFAVLIRFAFWAFTSRIWDDALITALHSENVFRGIGLTHFHRDGIPVPGFTSPIGVLIPLIGDFFHIGFGLTLIRIVSALAGGIAVLIGMLITRQLGMPCFLTLAAGIYLACDYHQILWGMAGMETQIATTVLLLSIWVLNENNGPVRIGVVMALCLFVRPDFLIWVSIMCSILLWRWHSDRNQKSVWKAVMTLAIAYAPWVLFMLAYYGSPIPNTVRAKFAGYPLWTGMHRPVISFLAIASRRVFGQLFAPLGIVYGGNGTGFYSLDRHLAELVATLLLIFGVSTSIRRRDPKMLPISLFLFAYTLYYVFLVPGIFGWYCVPVCAVGAIAILYGIQHAKCLCASRRTFAYIAIAVYVLTLVALLPIEFRSERDIQRYVENGVRKRMALYIKDHSSANETVGLEPLGYMSYYSGREIYDYPGLASREIARLLRNHPERRRLDHMLEYSRPDWIVLRADELKRWFVGHPENQWLEDAYVPVKEFSADARFRNHVLAPQTNADTDFVVFRKIVN